MQVEDLFLTLPSPLSSCLIFHKFLPVLNISSICSLFSSSAISIPLQDSLITYLDEKYSILLASYLVAFLYTILWQPKLLFRNKNLVFTHSYKILSTVAPDLFPIYSFTILLALNNPVSLVSSFLKTVKFYVCSRSLYILYFAQDFHTVTWHAFPSPTFPLSYHSLPSNLSMYITSWESFNWPPPRSVSPSLLRVALFSNYR